MITIYALVRSIDSYIFYIGLTNNPKNRLAQHRCGWRKTNDYHILHKKIRECNNDLDMITIDTIVDYNTAWQVEEFFISYALHLGFDLANRRGYNRDFSFLSTHLTNISHEAMNRVEILFLQNKSKFIW